MKGSEKVREKKYEKYQEEKPMITNFCIAVSPEGEKTINKEEIIKERIELL